MKLSFETGDRVRLSAAGQRSAKITDRQGVVLENAKLSKTQFWVQWDGLKRSQLIHESFLVKIEVGAARSV
jgi:hypothetical protein